MLRHRKVNRDREDGNHDSGLKSCRQILLWQLPQSLHRIEALEVGSQLLPTDAEPSHHKLNGDGDRDHHRSEHADRQEQPLRNSNPPVDRIHDVLPRIERILANLGQRHPPALNPLRTKVVQECHESQKLQRTDKNARRGEVALFPRFQEPSGRRLFGFLTLIRHGSVGLCQ